MNKIKVMDTTLRDGEQTPNVSYTPRQKVSIANALHDAGVDYIEVGSANVSEGERKGMESVVRSFREKSYPIDKLECLVYLSKDSIGWARDTGIETVNILSKGSRKQLKQLSLTQEEHKGKLLEMVDFTQDCGMKRPNVYLEHLSSPGGYRDGPDYVDDLIGDLIKSGKAKRITACDTLGLLSPTKTKEMISELVGKYPNTFFDFHGHNDLDMAVANTLSAVEAGCRGIQTTVNGMGERAGNAALHTVVLGLHDHTCKKTSIKEEKLYPLSKLVSNMSGVTIANNEPGIGDYVFTHSSGIHTDGMKKGDLYAGLDPKRLGRKYSYALGKHSGRATVEMHLRDMGEDMNEKVITEILSKVKELSDKKKVVTDNDLLFITEDVVGTPKNERVKIDFSMTTSGINVKPEAIVYLTVDGRPYTSSGQGNGGYDAYMNAMKKALRPLHLDLPKLTDYWADIPKVADQNGTNSLVKVVITWDDKNGKKFKTIGTDSDNTVAALKASVKMVNKVLGNGSS